MRRFVLSFRILAIFLLLLALMVVIVAVFAYLANRLGIQRENLLVNDTPVAVSPAPFDTPAAPFPPVDVGMVAYLDYGRPQYASLPIDALNPNVPRVGAYLPRTGNTQLVLPTVTPPPTLTPRPTMFPTATLPPYPTSPPLPTLLPTATLDLVATVLAFDASVPRPVFSALCPPSDLPVSGLLTQRFYGWHSGIDIGVPSGTPVLATHSAIVTWSDWNTFGYGNLVILQSDRYITYYAHLTSFNVLVGQYVHKGSIIGFSGNTGNSSGPHVHYETRIDDIPVDPLTFEARLLGTC
jgi:murein DD-endopeptidase MepM/ murein hydrolase activator NlpD